MTLKTFAILIGINAYKHDELTASVHDARRMRDALVKASIVQEGDCVLMTAPPSEGSSAVPTRKAISEHLFNARENKGKYERLIVFFSGHGEMTFSDADQGRPRTVILPADFEGKPTDRALNIDVEELLDLFRLAGPKEQIFIFDCCRKQAVTQGKSAGGGPLVWPAAVTGSERAQAAIYGVALKGVARAQSHKLGLMTKHILDALDDDSIALDYLIDSDLFGVTPETLTEYVKGEVRVELENSGFSAEYDLPTLVPRGPRASPLLSKRPDQVRDRTLTVVIRPPEAIPVAEVCLVSGGNSLHRWPPDSVPFEGKPARYGIRSSLKAPNEEFLPPEPAFEIIDLRKISQRVVEFRRLDASPRSEQLPTPALVNDREEVLRQFELRHARVGDELPVGKSRIIASATDGFTFVEIVGLQRPFEVISGFFPRATNSEADSLSDSIFEAEVAPGLYEVRFKLGTEVYSRAEIEALEGQTTLVQATAGASPLIVDTLPGRFTYGGDFTSTGEISESIGKLQGGVAATLLPALAMRPFDSDNQFLSHFPVDVRLAPEKWPQQPLSVVVGIDGELEKTKSSWDALFKDCVLTVRALGTAFGESGQHHAKLLPLSNDTQPAGLHRLASAIMEAPSSNFAVTLESSLLPFPISIVAAALPGRVTALSILIVPYRSFDVGINLLQYPDLSDQDEAGNPSGLPFPRKLRMLQIAHRLFASRQLYDHNEFLDLLWFKWLDPIVGVMALLELLRSSEEQRRLSRAQMMEAAHNLRRYFADLPDVHVVAALICPDCRRELLDFQYDPGIPVLAECVRHLAILRSEADGRESDRESLAEPTRLDRLAGSLQLGQPWSVITAKGDSI
jgi:hypothetical protein